MNKALAEFVMRGRLQALLVIAFASFSMLFSWVAAAVVALVTLRKGVEKGAGLAAWGVLPTAAVFIQFGDPSALIMLIAALFLAAVLRLTVSLPYTLIATVVLGLLLGIGLFTVGAGVLTEITAALADFFQSFQQNLAASNPETTEAMAFVAPTEQQVAGQLVNAMATVTLLCVLLARWWQAMLFNPGGFGKEFKSLHLAPRYTVPCIVLALAAGLQGMEYSSWAMLFMLPLVFAGLALVHARATLASWSTGTLVLFYIGFLLFYPIQIAVMLAAVADSWMDFRRQWSPPNGPSGSSDDT